MTSDSLAWRDLAGCRDTDPEAFYPEHSYGKAYALRVCARCEVRAECLDWALEHEEWGTWGGMTEYARREILAGRRRDPRVQPAA